MKANSSEAFRSQRELKRQSKLIKSNVTRIKSKRYKKEEFQFETLDHGAQFIFKKLFKPKKDLWLQECLDANESSLIAYVYKIVSDLEIARDIVQESFLKLWEQKQEDLEGRETPWLFAVSRNRAYDYLRGYERKHRSDSDLLAEIPDSAPSAEQNISEQEDERTLEKLFANLNEAQKEVLHLKFQQGLSYKEISKITGMSVNHVGVFIHNAMTHLKEKARGGTDENK